MTKFVIHRNKWRGTEQTPYEVRTGPIDGATVAKCNSREEAKRIAHALNTKPKKRTVQEVLDSPAARDSPAVATLVDATQRLGPHDTEASERQATLGVFLDEWEKEHGPITSVELDIAGKELRKKSQVIRKTKTVKPKR